MVVPSLIGYWIDLKLGTRFAFLLLGTVFGFTTGLMSLMRMVRPAASDENHDRKDG